MSNQEQTSEIIPVTGRKIPSWLILQIWTAILAIASGGVGFAAASMLLKLPTAPECETMYWKLASAQTRLYCAQIQAESRTLDSLLGAIALVEELPETHPMSPEINRYVEKWTTTILNLGEEKFQAGKLEEAIEIARKIPLNLQSQEQVETQIQNWREIWSEGEKIAAEIERELQAASWNQAFRAAISLTEVKNNYWSKTQYEEIINKIQIAQEESGKLDGAYEAVDKGGLDDLLMAIAQTEEVNKESYAYNEAENLKANAKNKLLQYIQGLIDNRQWQELSAATAKIPQNLNIEEQVEDWTQLVIAGQSSDIGTIEALEQAIASAEKIDPSRAVYYDAQKLIERWRLEIEDVKHLDLARQLARGGSIGDYASAIAEAGLIPKFNPRYEQAQREIENWNDQIQIIQDQPLLNRSQEIAREGNARAWKEAIAQANMIRRNSPLYGKAQREVAKWQRNIELEEDGPYLEQAINLANANSFAAAIETAEKIGPGRVLYNEAQDKIKVWGQEIKAKQDFEEANRIAVENTKEALGKAIAIAQAIPDSTQWGNESDRAINRWADQLLALAIDKADFSLAEAIEIAEMIPSNTAAYDSAQTQILIWKKKLDTKPPLVMPEADPFSEEEQPAVERNNLEDE